MVKRRRLKDDRKLDVRKRHSVLMNMEGWYDAFTDYTSLPEPFATLYREYVSSGSSLKFTRWCSRNNLIEPSMISKLGKMLEPVRFKLSCRHNDLLRLADTRHYKSCFTGWRGVQQLRYLADPDIGVVFVPDASGKFMWRSVCRLIRYEGKYGLILQHRYGNSNELAIMDRLNTICPIFLAHDYAIMAAGLGQHITKLNCVTRHNNKVVGHHVWSDHKVSFNSNNRLEIKGVSYSIARQSLSELLIRKSL